MKNQDLKVGMQVYIKHYPNNIGIIESIVRPPEKQWQGKANVKWSDDSVSLENYYDLIDSSLEKKFAEVAAKIKQAVQLLSEANEFVRADGKWIKDLSDDGILNGDDLIYQIDNAGWNTSSLGC